MSKRRTVYFISISENAPVVLQEAVLLAKEGQEVMIFFDLDGSRVLDQRYAGKMKREGIYDILSLFDEAKSLDVKLYGCQMNVMIACGMQCIDGIEHVGVSTFLDLAYDADAVFSY